MTTVWVRAHWREAKMPVIGVNQKRGIRLPKDRISLILLLVIPLTALSYYLLQEIRIAGSAGFPLDDAWIFWVFAKNLATGNGFSFNPGQAVLGTTSVLWVLILACSYLATHNVILISKFWGIALFLAAVLFTYRICLFHTRKKLIALMGAVTFALAPALIIGALSGMDISLATLFLCLTLYFYLKERGKSGKIFLAPIFGGLCFAARPELITVYPLILIHEYIFGSKRAGRADHIACRRVILRKLVTFALFLCPTFLFSYLAAGSLLPNTLAAKTLDSGLIWGISNGNLHEILISLTLNPFVWGGCMLVLLVCLNLFWSFFWSNGFVQSFLKRDTLLYPMIFLTVPMVRGIVAPLSNPLLAAHRYVSFLFPLLAVFFVIGWEGIGALARAKAAASHLKRWLFVAAAISVISALIFYFSPLVKKDVMVSFFSLYYFPGPAERLAWLSFSDFKFIFWFSAFFISAAGLLGTVRFFSRSRVGRGIIFLLLITGMILQTGVLMNRSERNALSIGNINEMQVKLGKWMNRNIPPASLVAINDVGAIRFFGNRRCLDLEGLVSPEIIPYKILGKESYIVYLNKHRPDYFMIFPVWYPPLMGLLSLKEGILQEIRLEDNIGLGGQWRMIVAKPDWGFFDSTLQESGLLEVEPYVPQKSFRRRWYDAHERQGVFPDWRVYHVKGRQAEVNGDLETAERFYKKAESYDPQHHEFYLQLAAFYKKKGDNAKVMSAFRKSVKYQLFPPP
jgi:hypothetical protein